MYDLTARLLVSDVVEANADRATVRDLGAQALRWLDDLELAEQRIVSLEAQLINSRQATLRFVAG